MKLARIFAAEIISADSRQVYRYLDIGTDKPTRDERRAVDHYLVDMLLPSDPYSVVDFTREARNALRSIAFRGKVALLVGGTGHYARSLLEGREFPTVEPDEALRASAVAYIADKGIEAGLAEIAHVDPATAARLDRVNPRRVARALEIVRATGNPIGPVHASPIPALVLGLSRDRRQLYDAVDERVDRQIAAGLVEETRRVLDLGFSPSLPVLSGLAYGQMVDHLAGKLTLPQAIEAQKFATHALIRRQLTWFRKEPRIQWLDAADPSLITTASELIAGYLEGA